MTVEKCGRPRCKHLFIRQAGSEVAVAAKQALLDERKAYVAEQANDKRRLAR